MYEGNAGLKKTKTASDTAVVRVKNDTVYTIMPSFTLASHHQSVNDASVNDGIVV